METEIIYNEDGTVNVEATVQEIKDEVAKIDERCEREQKVIDAFKDVVKDVEGLDFPEITDAARMLLAALKEEKTVVTLKPYNPEEDEEKTADLFYWMKNAYRDDEQLIVGIIIDLFYYDDCSDYSKYFVGGRFVYNADILDEEDDYDEEKQIIKRKAKFEKKYDYMYDSTRYDVLLNRGLEYLEPNKLQEMLGNEKQENSLSLVRVKKDCLEIK